MSNCCEHGHVGASSVYQTLDELDFERGIWYAAQSNDLERLEKLLREGVCANQEDAAGYCALHYAARAGHKQICQRLLDAGATVDATTRAGHATALQRAASAGKADIVSLLLSAGANCKLQDADGKTALHRAVEHHHIDIARILIEACPHLRTVPDVKGRLPVESASDQDLIRLFE